MSDLLDSFSPIVIFAYNRLERLSAMMDSLSCCDGFAQSPLCIYVDGPKSPSDVSAVKSVRDYVDNLPFPNVSSIFHDENLGLRRSISSGVTNVIKKYGRAIILEDDLVLSPIALKYFNTALNHYQDDDNIWSIVGYAYDAPSLRDSNRTLTLPFTHPWGWATWARAWRHFDLDGHPSQADLTSEAFHNAFNMNGLYPFATQLQNSMLGRVNSWYIHWYYALFRNGACSIFPPRRVLDNYGLSSGSHASSLNPFDRFVKRPALLTQMPEFSDPTRIDYAALDTLRRCWEMRVHRGIAQAGAIKRKLKDIL